MTLTTLLLASSIASANPYFLPGAQVTLSDQATDAMLILEGHKQIPKFTPFFYAASAGIAFPYDNPNDTEFVFHVGLGLDSLDTNKRTNTGIRLESGLELRDQEPKLYAQVQLEAIKSKTLELAFGPTVTYDGNEPSYGITARASLILK